MLRERAGGVAKPHAANYHPANGLIHAPRVLTGPRRRSDRVGEGDQAERVMGQVRLGHKFTSCFLGLGQWLAAHAAGQVERQVRGQVHEAVVRWGRWSSHAMSDGTSSTRIVSCLPVDRSVADAATTPLAS